MTAGHDRLLAFTVDQLISALLEVAATARWPNGPLLLDLDGTVLREQVAPRLLTALVATGGTRTPLTPRCGRGAQPQSALGPHDLQEHPC